ncbi:MAG: hypothetical protein AB1758_12505 [Candidatus Eremiobacterota bacterium]
MQQVEQVDHFRPKAGVAGVSSHPGYYWLAYVWENLYPTCSLCNCRRRDKPTWQDPTTGPARGKQDQFPLSDELTRAQGPDEDTSKEARLLLDPCEDDPEAHLMFGPQGVVTARNFSMQGKESIRAFHLSRKRLNQHREAYLRYGPPADSGVQ